MYIYIVYVSKVMVNKYGGNHLTQLLTGFLHGFSNVDFNDDQPLGFTTRSVFQP